MASDHTSPCVLVQVYDAAGNGYISRLELANVLRAIVATHNTANPMPEDDFLRLLNAVFESMDILGDNRISFDGAACACEWVWCHIFTVGWCAEFKTGLSENPMLMEVSYSHSTISPTLTLEARTPQLGVATPLPTRSHRWRLWPAC